MEASVTSRSAQVLFRYRTGDVFSAWMRSEELRAHAADGRLKRDSSIQQVGKEQWVPAAKVPGLWGPKDGAGAGAGAGGSAAGADAMDDAHHHDGGGPGDSRAASRNGGQGSGGSTGEQAGVGNERGQGQATHPHHMRVGESLQHLLQRAVLGQVTVCAPEFAHSQRAVLVGVLVDAFALEFEACKLVVFVPWAQLRAVALPSASAHTAGRIKEQASALVIDLEHLPSSVAQAVQAAAVA